MLNLAEYRDRADRLADHLPWAALVAPGVVLNKDGSFQRTLRFRGPDLESATEAELARRLRAGQQCAQALRLGLGPVLRGRAASRRSAIPRAAFPIPRPGWSTRSGEASFDGERDHYESRYHLTLVWLPPADAEARAERALVEQRRRRSSATGARRSASFVAETDRALDLLAGFMPEVRALDDGETLTYLHDAVSAARHPVAVPETPIYLDALLADTPLTGGLEPMLGELHLRTLTVLGFPALSRPGILDALNHQDFAYRWVTRFIALDKTDATKRAHPASAACGSTSASR